MTHLVDKEHIQDTQDVSRLDSVDLILHVSVERSELCKIFSPLIPGLSDFHIDCTTKELLHAVFQSFNTIDKVHFLLSTHSYALHIEIKMAIQQLDEPSTFKGTSYVGGEASGVLMTSDLELSFWGGVSPQTGHVIDKHHPLSGQELKGRVLAKMVFYKEHNAWHQMWAMSLFEHTSIACGS